MGPRWQARLALALAALLAVPGAVATHMSSEQMNPVEHDDLGRSDEPNFAGTTSLLGLPLEERNVDVTLAGIGQHHEPNGQALAPGCTHTDEHGNNVRDRSGMCGLYTVGVGSVNEGPDYGNVVPPGKLGDPPTQGDAAPGRFTPTKESAVMFLDERQDLQATLPVGGTSYLDVGHPLEDSGVAALLAQQGLGNHVMDGPVAVWAWFGTWRDLNGNGVIDALQVTCPPDDNGVPVCGEAGGQGPGNEFVWLGKCTDANGHDGPPDLTQCARLPVTMPEWVVPGDHHSVCFATTTDTSQCLLPLTGGSDVPGRQVLCFADVVAFAPIGLGGAIPATCPYNDGDLRDLDEYDQDNAGDPLLGPQDSVRVDDVMADRTGDPTSTTRMWVGGIGWPAYFYDGSVLITTTFITGATSQPGIDAALPTWYDLRPPAQGGPMRFLDVDRVQALNPLVDQLVQGTVKPAVRGPWVLVRDSFPLLAAFPGQVGSNRLLYDACDTSYLGVCPLSANPRAVLHGLPDPLQGLDKNPEQGREPNDPRDVEPGATYRTLPEPPGLPAGFAAHIGWLNDYRGYADWHGYVDVDDVHGAYPDVGSWQFKGRCVVCLYSNAVLPEPDVLGTGRLRQPGDAARVLQPGAHVFQGVLGGWRDRPQAHHEAILDVGATIAAGSPAARIYDYAVPPDAWPGDILNNTGALRSTGYGPETCTIGGVTAQREWAFCHPTRDGDLALSSAMRFDSDPATGGEFRAPMDAGKDPAATWTLRLTPGSLDPGAGDCWSVPVLVWQDFLSWDIGDTAAIKDYTGACGADAVIPIAMVVEGTLYSADEVLLPAGNLGLPVLTSIGGTVAFDIGPGGGLGTVAADVVRDVDAYAPYTGVA